MKKLIAGMMMAVMVLTAGVASAQCASCAKPEGAKADGAKMCCPCMAVQGITLTADQKAKVDAMQAKCKDGCAAGCCKACAAAMKDILTPEQLATWKANMAAAKKGAGSCTAPTAPKP